jgi:hypothetical protein
VLNNEVLSLVPVNTYDRFNPVDLVESEAVDGYSCSSWISGDAERREVRNLVRYYTAGRCRSPPETGVGVRNGSTCNSSRPALLRSGGRARCSILHRLRAAGKVELS